MIPVAAIGPVAGLVKGVLDRVLPVKMSEAERAAVEAELLKLDWQAIQAQLGVNAEEAKHESVFVSGWRPFIGWTCRERTRLEFRVCPAPPVRLGRMWGANPPTPHLGGK